MLALMPSTPPTTEFRPSPPPLTMSLAVLPHTPVPLPSSSSSPSSAPLSYPSIPTLGPPKRPKLTLNTASVPTTPFGKSTTGLRIETLSVASPTSRNTFQNAYGSIAAVTQPARPSTTRSHAPTPLRTSSSDSVASVSSTSTASSDTYATSASSTDSISLPVPYRLPYNSKSILVNGPLPRARRQRSFTTIRPMFPSPKKVSFRANLSEEIHTEKYTVAHIELESSSSSISTLDLPPPQLLLRGSSKSQNYQTETEKRKKLSVSSDADGKSDPRSPHVGEKRESSDEEEDSDTCPSTPITRRSKKRREWVWTLGPIKSQSEETSAPTKEDIPSEEGNQIKQ